MRFPAARLLFVALIFATHSLQAGDGPYARVQYGSSAQGFGDGVDMSFGATVGYRLTPNLAAEIGYHDLGGTSEVSPNRPWDLAETRTVTFGVDARYPAADQGFYLAGRFGMHRYENQGNAVVPRSFPVGNLLPLTVVRFDDHGYDTYFGLGVGYALTTRLSLELNWTRFNSDVKVPATEGVAGFRRPDHNMVSALSAEFRF